MGKKLLVADDSLTIQKVIKLALHNDGYEIQTVSDGKEALTQLALFRPDVVLVDIALPGKTAFEVKMEANEDEDLKRIPFVLMSSAFEKVDEAKVALLQFDGRLTKPFDPSHLRLVLTKAMEMASGMASGTATPSIGLEPGPSIQIDAPIVPDYTGAPKTLDDTQISFAPPPFSTASLSSLSSFSSSPAAASKQFNYSNPSIKPPPVLSPGEPKIELNDPIWAEGEGEGEREDEEDSVKLDLDELTPLPGEGPAFPMDREFGSAGTDPDIRNLTETTVKMSGLDEFSGWNIADSSKSPIGEIPSIFARPNEDTPPPAPSSARYEPESIPMPKDFALDIDSPEITRTETPLSYMPPPPAAALAPNPGAAAFSEKLEEKIRAEFAARIDAIVASEVEKRFREMALRIFPDVAEKVVKAEIRKLLDGLKDSS